MLPQLWDHISNCYARAAEARRRAEQTADPERRADLLLMEESWKRLAQSYELSERLGALLLDQNRSLSERMDWRRAAVAPFDRELEVATIGASGIDVAAVPCRRLLHGWIASSTGMPLDFEPTHWREWSSKQQTNWVRTARARPESAVPQRLRAVPLPLQSNE